MSTRFNASAAPARGEIVAPSFIAMLEDADALLALMGSRPLDVVAEIAKSLTNSAIDAGAAEVAAASTAVRRMASARDPVALAAPMRDLTDAILRARSAFRLDA